MLTNFNFTILGLGALALSGCTMDATATDAEPIGSVSQEVDLAWNANGFPSLGRATSVNVNDVAFLWVGFNLAGDPRIGYLCTGSRFAPCSNPMQFYQTPFPPSTLRGAAISKSNGLVYAYFDNGKVTEGIASNLASRRILQFVVPAGLSMSQLVEVEQSSGGTWHYWWKKADGVMVYTTSQSATNGGTVKVANVPYIPFPWVINGVLIDDSNPNTVWTYYSANNGERGMLNISDTASNLHQL